LLKDTGFETLGAVVFVFAFVFVLVTVLVATVFGYRILYQIEKEAGHWDLEEEKGKRKKVLR